MGNADREVGVLGVAFLLQFVTSFVSGLFIHDYLIEDEIDQTLGNIAEHSGLFRLGMFLDLVTALGVVFLGAMLYSVLKAAGPRIALVALGVYVLEASLLVASKLSGAALLQISEAHATSADPAAVEVLGEQAVASMDFVGSTLHLVAFGVGAILFYFLLYRSEVVPRWLSLWGLITVAVVLAAAVVVVFDYEPSFVLIIPYVPFELVLGLWLLVIGFRAPRPRRVSVPPDRPGLAGPAAGKARASAIESAAAADRLALSR